jgi:NADH-quinone oxidoreductase subunit G
LCLSRRTNAAADGLADAKPMSATEIHRLPVRFTPELPHGTAGFPVGLAGMGNLAGIALPAWCELKKAETRKQMEG